MFSIYLVAFVFAAMAFCLYSNSLGGPFVFDDIPNIVDNALIRIDRLDGVQLKRAAAGRLSTRPVANVSFALNYYLHGYAVFGYHLVNIAIHATNGALLYFLLLQTLLQIHANGGSRKGVRDLKTVPLLGALIWVVNPAQTQAVSYVVQRMTLLAATFYLAAMICFVYARQAETRKSKILWFAACMICTFLGVGSKEIVATLPFALILYEGFFFRDLDRQWMRRLALLGVVAIVGVFVGVWLYSGNGPAAMAQWIQDGYETRPFTLTERLLTQTRVLVFYLSLIVFPHPSRLNLDHDVMISTALLAPPTTLASLLLIIALVMLAVVRARKNRLASFAVFWFFGNLVVESSVIPLELVFEHRFYLPSMIIYAALADVVVRVWRPAWQPTVALILLVGLFSVWTYQRNFVWADNLRLMSDCVEKSPQKARPHYGLAQALDRRGRLDDAMYHYRRAFAIDSSDVRAQNALGSVLARKGRFAEAVAAYEKVLQIDPSYVGAYYNLGRVAWSDGRSEDAAAYFRKALQIQPHMAEAMVQLIWLLSSDPNPKVRNGTQAVSLAEHLIVLVGEKQPAALDALAAALAEAGRYREAAAIASHAAALAARFDMADLAKSIGQRRRVYLSGHPFRGQGVP